MGQVSLDRTKSGASLNADVRAGPWPGLSSECEITLHVFVDHSVVELIANATAHTSVNPTAAASPGIESTAIAAWVQPTSAASAGVALFSELPYGAAELVSLDVWSLRSP